MIPVELTQDTIILSLVTIIAFILRVVFKQSKWVSIIIARILVGIGMKVLSVNTKWVKEHKYEIEKLTSDWHVLKGKLKNDRIGTG